MKNLLVCLLAAGAIVTQAQPFPELRVMTTGLLLTDVVRHVGGDRVQVTTLVPPLVRYDEYTIAFDDLEAIADADMLLIEGTGGEPFLPDLLSAIDTPYWVVSEGISMLGRPAPALTPGDASLYMTLENQTTRDLQLITAEADWFSGVMIHETMVHNNMAHMMMRDTLALPPSEPIALEPGGLHIMAMGVNTDLVPGQQYPVTLRFSDGSEQAVMVSIRDFDMDAPSDAVPSGDAVAVTDAYAFPLSVFAEPPATTDVPLGVLGDDVTCIRADASQPAPVCNPAVFLDPANVAQWARNIALIFADADPAGADLYAQNLAVFEQRLGIWEASIAELIPLWEGRDIPSFNPDVYAYFAARYGVTLVEVDECALADLPYSPYTVEDLFIGLDLELSFMLADCSFG